VRTVFLGTPRAAVPSLRALAGSRHEVAGVVCRPHRRAGRGRRLHAPPVKEAALELGLPVLQPEAVKTRAFREAIAALEPEALVVVAYGRILGPRLRAVARHGALNVHFSLLPRWRGAAPVQRAILAGDSRSGVSLMSLVDELDAGPVYRQEAVDIGEGEHAPALEARLAELGAGLLLQVLDEVEGGGAQASPQDERGVTLAPPLRKGEGLLDPRQPASVLLRSIRALDPWPGARLELGERRITVLEASVREGAGPEAVPGTFLEPEGEALPLCCGEGSELLLERVKPAGRQAMSGRSLVDGRVVGPGERVPAPAGA
jgi:methionyl-tRNA formyltransferase